MTEVASPPLAVHQSVEDTAGNLTDRQKTLAYLTLMVALVLEIVDVTIVNTALPVIEKDFGSAAAEAQWVSAGYSLAFALLLMLGGRLGDALGYRRLFIGGVAGFTLASVLCGLSTSPEQLIAARVAQGCAGAMMAPQVMALIQVLFEPLERVAKLAWVGVIGGLSAIAGPIIGGLLIHANLFGLGWRSVFLINAPVGMIALIVAWKLLPKARSEHARGIDGWGTLMFAAGMASLLFPLVRGSDLGWQPWHFALLLAAPVLLLLVWRRTQQRTERGAASMFHPELFSQKQFPMGLMLALLFGTSTSGFLFVFAFGVQKILGYSPLQTGLLHIPFSVGVMIGIAFLGRKLIASHGKWVLVGGVTCMVLFSAGTLGWIATGGQGWWVLGCLALAGAGMGMTNGPLTPVILARVDRQHAGAASGLIKTVQELGMALGVAIVGTAFFASAQAGEVGQVLPAIFVIVALLLGCLVLAIRLPAPLFPEHDA
ncbi:MFS transporter [Novosphingobium mathurense]|uniref:Drug resistance transporter, EmrB/QacA subfamily n=1 Tax=Novosphingobium mathurense TaxID=428990 RepID=A0A1U6HWC4_9SPHN|nr:MFS transporter [Novosphingobium mathurense]SLK00133.1 drug resistance transporter, EmrB/QacA subfamily [Novosphingobium mathurense]